MPLAAQSRHKGSFISLRLRKSWPRLPLMRSLGLRSNLSLLGVGD